MQKIHVIDEGEAPLGLETIRDKVGHDLYNRRLPLCRPILEKWA
jgi:hypothetical protein